MLNASAGHLRPTRNDSDVTPPEIDGERREGIEYEDFRKEAPRRLRMARLGELADVAELVAFLTTEEARWIHGSIIDVDGGQNKGG